MLHEFYDRKYFWLLERLAGKAYLFALCMSDNFWLLGWDRVGIAQEESVKQTVGYNATLSFFRCGKYIK